MARKVKTWREKLQDELDRLWRHAIWQKYGNTCEVIGCTSHKVNAHHHFGKDARTTRWLMANGFCLCVSHHTLSSRFSAHKTPALFNKFALKIRGQRWEDELIYQHSYAVHWLDEEMEAIGGELDEWMEENYVGFP